MAEIKTRFHGFEANVGPSARWHTLATRNIDALDALDALVARAERMHEALRTGMRCGCLHIEDCDFGQGAGCTVTAPVMPARRVRAIPTPRTS